MQSIKGGKVGVDLHLGKGGASSSDHNFTCCWCTGGGSGTELTAVGCSPSFETN